MSRVLFIFDSVHVESFSFHCSPVHLSRGGCYPQSHVNRAGPVPRLKNIDLAGALVHGTGAW